MRLFIVGEIDRMDINSRLKLDTVLSRSKVKLTIEVWLSALHWNNN